MAHQHQPLSTQNLAVTKPATKTAALIYQYSVESANSLWAAYDLARVSRGKPRGITTDQEQDLLRAVVVSAASGCDAALKQLMRDSVPVLIKASESVHEVFEKFAQRRLQTGETGVATVSPKILARILAAPDPQKQLIEDYVYELTGDSLQSAEQLLKVCTALGVDAKNAVGDVKSLKDVFAARNQMIHELDMNLASPNRKRRVRGQKDMQGYAEQLLHISAAVIADVDARIGA